MPAPQLHILGSSSAVPRPGRANSGYLLQLPSAAIAVDFGSGAFSRLRQICEPSALDAVLVSHMHADHFFDLIPLRYALKYESPRATPLPVYVPPGGIRILQGVTSSFKDGGAFFDGIFDLHEYDPESPLEFSAASVAFTLTRHYIPAYAMRFELQNGAAFAFSADTAPCDAVERIARDAALFLCEAALGADGHEDGERGHMNAGEAGTAAAAAGCSHLVLTHYGANARKADLLAAAGAAFTGRVTIADDGMNLPLAGS